MLQPVYDPEKAQSEQDLNSLRKHRKFDNPHAVLAGDLSRGHGRKDRRGLVNASRFDEVQGGKEAVQMGDPEKAQADLAPAQAQTDQDHGEGVRLLGEVDQAMERDAKGLWKPKKKQSANTKVNAAKHALCPKCGESKLLGELTRRPETCSTAGRPEVREKTGADTRSEREIGVDRRTTDHKRNPDDSRQVDSRRNREEARRKYDDRGRRDSRRTRRSRSRETRARRYLNQTRADEERRRPENRTRDTRRNRSGSRERGRGDASKIGTRRDGNSGEMREGKSHSKENRVSGDENVRTKNDSRGGRRKIRSDPRVKDEFARSGVDRRTSRSNEKASKSERKREYSEESSGKERNANADVDRDIGNKSKSVPKGNSEKSKENERHTRAINGDAETCGKTKSQSGQESPHRSSSSGLQAGRPQDLTKKSAKKVADDDDSESLSSSDTESQAKSENEVCEGFF